MKKASKNIIKTAAALTGATLGLCEVIYEGALNRKLIEFMRKNQLFRDKEEQKYYDELPEMVMGLEWFDKVGVVPTATVSEDGKVDYSYIVRQENGSNLWAICVHGYSSEPKYVGNLGKHYFEKGYNVILPCMHAHSLDQNKYCSMGYYDRYIVCEWIKYIVKENPEAKILVHGISMGSATTMLVTGEDIPANVKCAVADCGYTTCWDEYEEQIGQMFHLPVYPFLPILNTMSQLRGNFNFKQCDPINAVSRSHTPTLFIHGEEDTFVPYRMLDRVYEACSAQKDKLSVPDAIHAVSSTVHPELYWPKVDEFTEKYMGVKVEA